MILGLAGAAACASVEFHLRLGVRWLKYVVEEMRTEGRTSCLQQRAAACEVSDMLDGGIDGRNWKDEGRVWDRNDEGPQQRDQPVLMKKKVELRPGKSN